MELFTLLTEMKITYTGAMSWFTIGCIFYTVISLLKYFFGEVQGDTQVEKPVAAKKEDIVGILKKEK